MPAVSDVFVLEVGARVFHHPGLGLQPFRITPVWFVGADALNMHVNAACERVSAVPADSDKTAFNEILTPAELESGEWIDETTTMRMTGLSTRALKQRRYRGSIQARPAQRLGKVTRDFWYWRQDVGEMVTQGNALPSALPSSAVLPTSSPPRPTAAPSPVASGDATVMRDLEMTMLRAEAREEMIARITNERDSARSERDRFEEEITRLRKTVDLMAKALKSSVGGEEREG